MASVTLTTMRTAVRELGDFPLSRKFSNDFVDREIQRSWTALHRIVEDVNEGYFDKEATAPTVANQAYVALTSTLADVRRVKGVDVLDGEYRALDQISIAERNRYSATNRDIPCAYRLSERGIELYPTPGAIYTLRVMYARKVTALGASAVEIDEDWQDYVIWSTITKLATTEERPTGDYERRAAEAEQAIRGGHDRRRAEPEYLPLREYLPDWSLY